MNPILITELIIAAAVYLIGALAMSWRMVRLTRKHHLKGMGSAILADSLLWPYYIFRYGLEGVRNELE